MVVIRKRRAQVGAITCAFAVSMITFNGVVSRAETTRPATVTGSSVPVPAGKIAKISVSGNKKILTDAILLNVKEKVGDPYNQDAADRDRDSIKNMGYFNGDVVATTSADLAGGVDLDFHVVENPVVSEIVFTANTPSGEPAGKGITPKELRDKMNTKPGQVLNLNTIVTDFDNLFNPQTGYVRSQGYIIAPSSADINIDPVTGKLTIPLIITHIDSIKITGNRKTKPIVITRELHSKSGDVLNEVSLQNDLRNIFNLGLFEQVGPFDPSPTDIGKVAITIPVVEKRSGQISVGVGYSSRAKLVGRAELAENNFRGMGERVNLMWEVGSVNSESSVDVGFYEPYIDKYHTSMSVDLFDRAVYRFSSDTFGGSSGDSNTYIEQHKGVSLGLRRPVNLTDSIGFTVRGENIRANNVQLPPQDLSIRQIGSVAAFGVNASRNTRDNDFSPASGSYNLVNLEFGTSDTKTVNNIAGNLTPGKHNFTKASIDLRNYISLQGKRKAGDFREPKKVVAVRLLLGVTNKEIPFYEQYFLGGAESLRAQQTDRFWGSNVALFQTELRIPMSKNNDFQGVLFTDIGDAWGSIYQDPQLKQHDKLTLSTNFGVGIRLVLPIGPIRLDYAFGNGGGRTQFSIGQSF